ncbi:hypothetical protein [Actinomadura sp. 9N407]|uniref:hypothetical protein n=1 Tax=Actinomadura sp. 9N407 TaxID=3375154 RepID=UPI003793E666
MASGQDRQASGTGAETAPEIVDVPDGRRAVLMPASPAARVGGGLVGVAAGEATSLALRPVVRRAAQRYGLPANAIVRGLDFLVPLTLALVLVRYADHRARVKVVRRVP